MKTARSQPPRPTDAELAILRVLWQRGPSTVREVLEALSPRDVGYTTVLKLLQIMDGKRLVARDDRERAHVYEAAVAQAETEGRLVADLLDRAFGGSAERLVMRALSRKKSSPAEIARLRELLDEMEGGRR
jgi:BlaI family transcriptional regulator, penicillinase repressor